MNIVINLSYKDACPKTVCQAVACGLPVLYANSGGVNEIVHSGIFIRHNKEIKFEDKIPELDINEILKSYKKFKEKYNELRIKALQNNKSYFSVLKQYFDIFKQLIENT